MGWGNQSIHGYKVSSVSLPPSLQLYIFYFSPSRLRFKTSSSSQSRRISPSSSTTYSPKKLWCINKKKTKTYWQQDRNGEKWIEEKMNESKKGNKKVPATKHEIWRSPTNIHKTRSIILDRITIPTSPNEIFYTFRSILYNIWSLALGCNFVHDVKLVGSIWKGSFTSEHLVHHHTKRINVRLFIIRFTPTKRIGKKWTFTTEIIQYSSPHPSERINHFNININININSMNNSWFQGKPQRQKSVHTWEFQQPYTEECHLQREFDINNTPKISNQTLQRNEIT